MKQVKVLVLTLIVLMGVGFTSCMNSDDNYTPVWQGPVEVISSAYGGTYFKIGELKIQPTATSLMAGEETYKFDPSSTKMAYIACTYSNDEASGNSGATNTLKNVTLNYAVSLDGTVESVTEKGASNDSVATAPIIRVTNVMSSTSTSEENFYILDNRYLFAGISYYVQEKQHSFTLVNYPNEEVEDGVIKFYLRHGGTPEKDGVTLISANVAGTYPYLYYKSFDLANYLPTLPGKEVKIIVEVDENTVNNKLDDERTKKREYSLTYKVEE